MNAAFKNIRKSLLQAIGIYTEMVYTASVCINEKVQAEPGDFQTFHVLQIIL